MFTIFMYFCRKNWRLICNRWYTICRHDILRTPNCFMMLDILLLLTMWNRIWKKIFVFLLSNIIIFLPSISHINFNNCLRFCFFKDFYIVSLRFFCLNLKSCFPRKRVARFFSCVDFYAYYSDAIISSQSKCYNLL